LAIDSYGGDAEIVASREEIQRVGYSIKQAAEALVASGSIEQLLLQLIDDPLRLIQFRIQALAINQKLEQLYHHCLLAAEGYFSAEAQIHRRFELSFVPQLAAIAGAVGASFGWQLDQQVSATQVLEARSLPPKSITNTLDRLWNLSSQTKPTIGIDIFGSADHPRTVVVYIPGTQSFSFGDLANPLDMQSNILAMSGAKVAASEKAVLLAMNQAGVLEKDEVIFVGHSQGGMVAANLAQYPSGYIAAGLITLGAPIAQLKLKSLPVMAIEHTNDPVPNLSGKANPIASNWVSVQRSSKATESDAPLHSHSLKSYRNTTEFVDQSSDRGVSKIRGELLSKLAENKTGVRKEFVIAREF
jgi:hypothetical protein